MVKFIGVLVLSFLMCYFIGMFIGSVCEDPKTSQSVSMFVYFVCIFLGGFTFPIEFMPSGLQKVAYMIPTTHAVKMVQRVWNGLSIYDVHHTYREDWIIVLTDRFENKVLRDLDKEIVANNHFIFLSENQPNSEKISLGPILIPRCTGGVNQMLENKCRKESVPFPAEVKKSDKKGIEEKLISKYMYEEILKFAIDRYSNYATEYSKLLGTQYELNYQEEVIQRKEFIISEEWL